MSGRDQRRLGPRAVPPDRLPRLRAQGRCDGAHARPVRPGRRRTGQNPLLRKYNMAYLYRSYGEALMNVSFGSLPVTLSASGFYGDDSYNFSYIGVTSGLDRRYGRGRRLDDERQGSAYLSAGEEKIDARSKGSTTGGYSDCAGVERRLDDLRRGPAHPAARKLTLDPTTRTPRARRACSSQVWRRRYLEQRERAVVVPRRRDLRAGTSGSTCCSPGVTKPSTATTGQSTHRAATLPTRWRWRRPVQLRRQLLRPVGALLLRRAQAHAAGVSAADARARWRASGRGTRNRCAGTSAYQ